MENVWQQIKVRKIQVILLVIVIVLIVFASINTQVYYRVDGCWSYWPQNTNCPTQPWSSYEIQIETKIAPLTWIRLSFNNEYEDSFRSLSVGLGIVVDSWTD
jgi:hypothetical protein